MNCTVKFFYAAKKPGGKVPSINAQFTDMTVSEGQEVILEALIDGVPPPKVEWLLGDKPLEEGKNLAITKDGKTHRLTIKGAASCHEGDYKIVASNKSASTSFSAEVLVTKVKTPTGKFSAQDVEVLEGEDASFEVIAENTDEVCWYRGDELLKKGRRYDMIKDDKGVNTLLVMRCRGVDAGDYSCELINESKKVKIMANLVVKKAESEVDEKNSKASTGNLS